MRRILTIGRRCLSATGPAARPVARRSTRVRGTPTPMMSAIERGSGLQTTPIAARGQPSKTNGCANAMRRILNIEKRFWSATAPFAGRIATRSTPRRGRPMPATTGIGRESGLPATSGTARRSGWHRSMGCRSRITTPCSPARAAPAPSASKRRPGGRCSSITATRPARCAGCSVMDAIAALGFMRDDHTRTSAATEYLLKLKRHDETK